MQRALMLVVVLVWVLGLDGCGASAVVVRSEAMSYDDVIEDTTNKLLLLNILRAKDKAPLHFAEIPSIHETIQANASLGASAPFGPLNKATLRDTGTASAGLQFSPSFEIDHIDAKDFITGLSNPIDPKFVKYWLDRGLDRRIILLLFFSAVDINKTSGTADPSITTIRVRNSPREALQTLEEQLRNSAPGEKALICDAQSQFQRYLKLINALTSFQATAVTERKVLARNLQLNPWNRVKDLADLAALDSTKFQWELNAADQSYTIYAVPAQPTTKLCLSNQKGGGVHSGCGKSLVNKDGDDSKKSSEQVVLDPPAAVGGGAVSPYCAQYNEFLDPRTGQLTADATAGDAAGGDAKPKLSITLEIRSVGEIIQFLGDLLEYQETLGDKNMHNSTARKLKLNDPVTFGYCDDKKEAGCDDVFFNLRHDHCNSRFAVSYRGVSYSVPNYNPPRGGESCPVEESLGMTTQPGVDHTLEILAVVHQLVDLQKSAQDIKETPYVQLVP